jgi:hypothetical protein
MCLQFLIKSVLKLLDHTVYVIQSPLSPLNTESSTFKNMCIQQKYTLSLFVTC